MLNFAQSLAIVVANIAAALLLVLVLNRVWPPEVRRAHNDLIGWQLSIVGTTYAVILGFMMYTVWTNYGVADLNADIEANAVVSLYRLADGLPAEQGRSMKELAGAYTDQVISDDWPRMAKDQVPEGSQALNTRMWGVLMSVRTASPTEITAEDHAVSELVVLTEHRRTRMLQSASRLPAVLWCVLIVGGLVTITSASMFGSSNVRLHLVQVFGFTLLVSLVLVAIADIDRPFQGGVHVSTFAFEQARQSMRTGF